MRYLAFVAGLGLIACGGSKSSPGGGSGSPDAASSAGPAQFGTPADTWTYVAVAGTACMDGSATGIAVNQGTSSDLVIYLEGGGACFNDSVCISASHPNGWGATDAAALGSEYADGIFDRTDAKNPLKDASFVFVPYCSGDIHAGSATNGSGFGGRTQTGYINIGQDLGYIMPKATQIGRVILAGSSAGGFGAVFNYDRTAKAFGSVPVELIDDSGPPLSDTYLTPCLQTLVRSSWNLAPAIPAGCTACTGSDGGGLGNAAAYLADAYKDRRFGLITSTEDGTIRSFLGFGYPNCTNPGGTMAAATYAAAITELRDTTLMGHDNFRVWSITSQLHVWLTGQGKLSGEVSNSVALGDWLTDLLTPADTFNSVVAQ